MVTPRSWGRSWFRTHFNATVIDMFSPEMGYVYTMYTVYSTPKIETLMKENMFFHTTYTSYHENYWILGHHIPGSIQQKSKRPRSVGIDRGSPRWRIDRWGTASAPRKLWNWWNAKTVKWAEWLVASIWTQELVGSCWIFEYVGYIIWYYFSHGPTDTESMFTWHLEFKPFLFKFLPYFWMT